MVQQEDFKVERWMDKYETDVEYNMAETCCYSLTLDEVASITGTEIPWSKLNNQRLVYGNIPGSLDLRKQVAKLCNNVPGGNIEITPEDVLATNGAIGANFLVYYALAGPGDHVIVVDPAYQQINSVPAMFGAEVDLFELKPENKYQPDLKLLKSMVKSNTKMVVINSPHNPSGAVFPLETLQQIVDVCRDANCYLMCDEVYRPLFHGCEATPSVSTMYEKAVVTGSTSKAFGLAGLRVGWVVTSDKSLLATCASRRDYNTICISMIDDIMASWALSGQDKLLEHNYKLCRQNLQILDDFVNSTDAIEYVKPTGGTTVFVKLVKVKDTAKFCHDFITQYRTLVVPGETFDKPGYLRIGYGNSKNELEKGLANLKEFMSANGYWS